MINKISEKLFKKKMTQSLAATIGATMMSIPNLILLYGLMMTQNDMNNSENVALGPALRVFTVAALLPTFIKLLYDNYETIKKSKATQKIRKKVETAAETIKVTADKIKETETGARIINWSETLKQEIAKTKDTKVVQKVFALTEKIRNIAQNAKETEASKKVISLLQKLRQSVSQSTSTTESQEVSSEPLQTMTEFPVVS